MRSSSQIRLSNPTKSSEPDAPRESGALPPLNPEATDLVHEWSGLIETVRNILAAVDTAPDRTMSLVSAADAAIRAMAIADALGEKFAREALSTRVLLAEVLREGEEFKEEHLQHVCGEILASDLSLLPEAAKVEARIRAYVALSLLNGAGGSEEAEQHLRRIQVVLETLSDADHERALALVAESMLHMRGSRWGEAEDRLLQAVQLEPHAGERILFNTVLMQYYCETDQHRLGAAIAANLIPQLRVNTQLDADRFALCKWALGRAALREHNCAAAIRHLLEAVQYFRDADELDPRPKLRAESDLAAAHWISGAPEKSVSIWRGLAARIDRLPSPYPEVSSFVIAAQSNVARSALRYAEGLERVAAAAEHDADWGSKTFAAAAKAAYLSAQLIECLSAAPDRIKPLAAIDILQREQQRAYREAFDEYERLLAAAESVGTAPKKLSDYCSAAAYALRSFAPEDSRAAELERRARLLKERIPETETDEAAPH